MITRFEKKKRGVFSRVKEYEMDVHWFKHTSSIRQSWSVGSRKYWKEGEKSNAGTLFFMLL